MTLSDVFRGVSFLINKDVSGYSFTPEQFTLVCRFLQTSIYTESIEAEKSPSNQPKSDLDVSLFTALEQLITSTTLTTPFTLPINFLYEKSVTVNGFNAEILDSKRYNLMVKNPFFESLRPPVKIENGIVVCPVVPTTLELIYYRKPLDPYFDWCIDVNGVIQYMEPGSWIVHSTGSLVRAVTAWVTSTPYVTGNRLTNAGHAWLVLKNLTSSTSPVDGTDYQDLGLSVILTNVTHVSSPSSDYYSLSVELDLKQQFYERFIQMAYKYAITNLTGGVK